MKNAIEERLHLDLFLARLEHDIAELTFLFVIVDEVGLDIFFIRRDHHYHDVIRSSIQL